MLNQHTLQIGINGRFFPTNWRPALDEIAFIQANNLRALQFHGNEAGLAAKQLGSELAVVSAALRDANIAAVMEIIVRVDARGRTTRNGNGLAWMAISGYSTEVQVLFSPDVTIWRQPLCCTTKRGCYPIIS